MFGKKNDLEEKRELSVLSSHLESKHVVRIPYRIVREKNGKLITIRTGRIPRHKKWILWPREKVMFYNSLSAMDYTRSQKKDETQELILNFAYAEPYDPTDKTIKYSPEVEHALINQSLDDYSEVVSLTGFEITMRHIIIMLVVFAFTFPVGISLNPWFHIVSNVNIHWLPFSPFH
jgi:hypothetical protein